MAVRVTRFAGEFEALARLTGDAEEDLRQDDDYRTREHWLAWDGAHLIGALHPWRSPDGRLHLFFDSCRADAYGPLAGRVDGECRAPVDASDDAALGALRAAGFVHDRRELQLEVPVAPLNAPVPTGVRVVSADQTTLEPLMLLDCALRDDVPGSGGWALDPAWFDEETYRSPYFDPDTYRVALHGEAYVGLARVWRGPERDRLGLVGVLAPFRRRGVARALLGAAFQPLIAEGVSSVSAEVDATNVASLALFEGLGAVVVGGTIELRRWA